jgi:hypothetical protein
MNSTGDPVFDAKNQLTLALQDSVGRHKSKLGLWIRQQSRSGKRSSNGAKYWLRVKT